MKKYMKKAFTLADVLITLAIIGIIAALTIPALLKNTGIEENIARLKKNYSVISQATMLIMNDYGGTLTGICSDDDCWVQLYKAKLNSIKTCPNSPVGACWQANLPDPFVAYAASDPVAGLVLSDGTFVGFTYYNSNCTDNTDGLASCARIDIDVNGNKGQKLDGEDVYSFHLTLSGIKPFGSNDGKPCDTIDRSGCTAIYITGGQAGAVPESPPPPDPPSGPWCIAPGGDCTDDLGNCNNGGRYDTYNECMENET